MWVLAALGPGRAALVLALVAGVLYADGHGIHLAANSIANEAPTGDAERMAIFWDEGFSHVEWHLGWIGLLAAFGLAESRLPPSPAPYVGRHLVSAVLLGFTLFTSTVEGGTWWLVLAAAAVFSAWQCRAQRPVLATASIAFVLAALLIGIWAIWHGGVPQFSEVGLI